MATEMFKADNDLLSIAIVCHIANPRPIKFSKLSIIYQKIKTEELCSFLRQIFSTKLFENLNSLNGD